MEVQDKRFATEVDANKAARKLSEDISGLVSVVLSASDESPDKPYIVEEGDGGMLRSWEALVSTFEAGTKLRV